MSVLFSVVVPTLGRPGTRSGTLPGLLRALQAQSFPRERFEIVLVFDGLSPTPETSALAEQAGARIVPLARRSGPGAARNAGVSAATGEWLAFTEDDVTPSPDWLEQAAARIMREPAPDAIEGVTQRPGDRALRIRPEAGLQYLPTTLFVRRAWFERVGGYEEAFYEPSRGVYFREDADFGFKLEEANALTVREESIVVTHPDEHPGPWDPVRWAVRYEMDPLLARLHPRLFRKRIEVHRVGPFRVRRPIVRACVGVVLCVVLSAALAVAARPDLARLAVAAALVLFLPVWAKWRFSPLHFPAALVVPFALTLALLRGRGRTAARRRAEADTPVP